MFTRISNNFYKRCFYTVSSYIRGYNKNMIFNRY
nr:MAG TPA: hypothetical protein [Caudoviricetes sp.]